MMSLSLAPKFRWVQCLILALLFGLHCAAAPFQNLDFEQANTNSIKFDAAVTIDAPSGLVTDLIPGWQVFLGTNLTTSIAYNGGLAFFEDGGGPMLVGPSLRSTPPGDYVSPLVGQFSFGMEVTERIPKITLAQRGDVPANAGYLVFSHSNTTAPTLSIDGVMLFRPSGAAVFDPTPVRVDISKFAGKNVELEFSSEFLPSSDYVIDDIHFLVPEPGTFALFGLGALGLLTIGRRRRILQRKC